MDGMQPLTVRRIPTKLVWKTLDLIEADQGKSYISDKPDWGLGPF
jgi:hypothetical protein